MPKPSALPSLSYVEVDLHAPVHLANLAPPTSSASPAHQLVDITKHTSVEISRDSFRCPCTATSVRPGMTKRFLVSCYPCSKALGSATPYTKVSGLLLLLATIVNLVAIGTPYWEYVVNELGSSHSGLWWVCFMGKCDQLIRHPLYGWFRGVQALLLLSALSQGLALTMMWLYVFVIALSKYTRRFLLLAASASLLAGGLGLAGVVVYGVYQGGPDVPSLSWSFYLAVFASLLTLLSAACLFLETHRLFSLPCPADEAFILQRYPSVTSDPLQGAAAGGVERRERSESTLSVSSLMSGDNPEKRPLNKSEVRMRSYSSSLMTPIPETPPSAHSGDTSSRRFTFSETRQVSA